jgi:hypothetical protein
MSAKDFFDAIPKINTSQMDELLARITPSFRGARQTGGYWICGRSTTFGFRPSFKKEYLPIMIKEWYSSLSQGYIMITPLIFYICDHNDPEVVISSPTPDDKKNNDFLVYNHYNLLISHLTQDGSIYIERYEPADSSMQGDLDSRLETLFKNTFKTVTKQSINYKLINPVGLQSKYGDNTLCGHHILYWAIYRLKYGDKAAVKLIESHTDNGHGFVKFCSCLNEFRESCLIGV